MASKIQPPREAIQGYVLSLALMRETDEGWWPEAIVGTGFLVAEGRGLGVTATHVAKVLENHPTAAAVALFVQVSGKWEALPILKFDPHPVEDVALFRVIDDDYFSPFTVAADQHYSSAPYELWGYPEDVHYDRMADLGAPPPISSIQRDISAVRSTTKYPRFPTVAFMSSAPQQVDAVPARRSPS